MTKIEPVESLTEARALLQYLEQFVTPERSARMDEVLAERTRYVTVLIEDVYQPQNASAVVRSCDGFGIQELHIVENRNRYRVNPQVALGSAQWVELVRYKRERDTVNDTAAGTPDYGGATNSLEAVHALRERGYRIVATTPHREAWTPDSLPLERGRIALCFGNELDGLSEPLLEAADDQLRIPMYGFVESFNISVAAAVTMSGILRRLRGSSIQWRLPPNERVAIKLRWLRRQIKGVRQLEEAFYSDREEIRR